LTTRTPVTASSTLFVSSASRCEAAGREHRAARPDRDDHGQRDDDEHHESERPRQEQHRDDTRQQLQRICDDLRPPCEELLHQREVGTGSRDQLAGPQLIEGRRVEVLQVGVEPGPQPQLDVVAHAAGPPTTSPGGDEPDDPQREEHDQPGIHVVVGAGEPVIDDGLRHQGSDGDHGGRHQRGADADQE
jgi:hypothetical protein